MHGISGTLPQPFTLVFYVYSNIFFLIIFLKEASLSWYNKPNVRAHKLIFNVMTSYFLLLDPFSPEDSLATCS